jgi:hypothetical protein
MGERIYKGTAEVNGTRQPVTVKIVNAPASRAGDLDHIRKYHDNLVNLELTQVYDSDKPAQYASIQELTRPPAVPDHLMAPVPNIAADAARNIPPKEASIPPPNAPSGPAIIQAHPAAAPVPATKAVPDSEATIPVADADVDPDARQPR